MKILSNTLLVAVALIVASCTPYSLTQSKVLDKGFDFANFKTYSIIAADPASMPPGLTMMDFQILSKAIKHQMSIRGYQLVDDSPIQIQIGITVKEDIQTKDALPPASRMYFGPRASYLRSYYNQTKLITDIRNVGRLTIDLVDDANQRYLYTATVSNVVSPDNQKMKQQSEVDAAVAELFKNYPIKPKE